MCISRGTGTPRRAEASLSCGSSTSATPKTQWTPWTARCSTGGSFGFRWLDTEGRQTPCTAGEALRQGDTDTDAEAGAVQPVLAVEDVAAAGPGAEAARDPGAATITAAPGPVPTPDPGPGPSLSPNPEPPGGASQSRPPDLGPVPGPSQGVEPQLPTEGRSRSPGPGPGPNPRVDLNPQGTPEQSLNPNVDAT